VGGAAPGVCGFTSRGVVGMLCGVEKARNAAKGDKPEEIKSAISELEAAAHAFSKTLYERAAASAGTTSAGGTSESGGAKKDDDTIDAEFEVK